MSMAEDITFNYEKSKKSYIELLNSHQHAKIPYFPYNEKEKNEFISLIEDNKEPYKLQFDVIEDSNNTKLLILKRRSLLHPLVEVLPATKCFDVMAEVHLLEDHDFQLETLNKVYHIPKALVIIFLQACNVCSTRSDKRDYILTLKQITVNTIQEFSALCTVVKLSSEPDNSFSEFIVYVDALTNYVLIRPTHSSLHVIAYEMLKIFLDFGLPESILVSQIDTFWFAIMDILKSTNVFSHLPKVIQKRNAFKLNQISQTAAFLINSWMKMRNSPNWAVGLKEVQWQLNNLLDSKLSKSRKLENEVILTPYHAHFGFLPNHSVIQRINELKIKTTPEPEVIIKKNMMSFEDNCLCCCCDIKIYKIFYKTCVVCNRKCHINCCVMHVVEISSNIRNLEARCHRCETAGAIR